MIDYQYIDDIKTDETLKDIIITDGTVVVNNHEYTVVGQTVVITNDLIESGFAIHQRLCTQEQLKFGSCEAAECSVNVFDNIPSVQGKTMSVYIYVNKDADTMLKLGVFKVTQDKLVADRTKREILMYDAMHDILSTDVKSWYDTILPNTNTTVTMLQFRTSFLSYFGITVEPISLINDSAVIKRGIEVDTLSGGDVIRAICEFNGCFGTITNEGKFRFLYLLKDIDKGLYPSDTLFPSNSLYPEDVAPGVDDVLKSSYMSVRFEDYNCESIDGLIIRTDEEDNAVSVGVLDGNTYVIGSNFLFNGLETSAVETIAGRILSQISDCYYKPCEVECIGNPCHELGDPIRISTTYRGVVTYILERNMSGIKPITDRYTSKGKQIYEEDLTGVQSQIRQVNGKIASLKVNSDSIESRVEDIETGSATVIQQLDWQLLFKVSKGDVMDSLNEEMSSISLSSNAIDISSGGSVRINAGATFSVNSPNFVIDESSKIVKIVGSYGTVELNEGRLIASDFSNRSCIYTAGGIVFDGYNTYITDGSGATDGLKVNGSTNPTFFYASGSFSIANGQITNITNSGNTLVTNLYAPSLKAMFGGDYNTEWKLKSSLTDSDYVLCAH